METHTNGAAPAAELAAAGPEDQGGVAELGFGAGGRAVPEGVPDPELRVEQAKRRSFTAKYKLKILEKAEACTRPGEVGELLRREGLYSSHLVAWRKQRRDGALVLWRPPRPAAEHIPRAVKVVSVKVSDPRRHLHFTEEVNRRGKVKAIVAIIEGLQREAGGARSSPAEDGKAPVIDLLLRKRAGTPPLAGVRVAENGCGSVSFYRGGRQQPVLGEAHEAVEQLHHILGRTL